MLVQALAETVQRNEERLDRIDQAILELNHHMEEQIGRWKQLVNEAEVRPVADVDGIQIQFPIQP